MSVRTSKAVFGCRADYGLRYNLEPVDGEDAVRKAVPSIIRKRLTQESQSTCPFCGEDDVATAEFHHIIPISEGGTNSFENLIYICANCHSKVTQGQIPHGEVNKVKKLLGEGKHPFFRDEAAGNVIHADFTKGANLGVVANAVQNVEIKTTRGTVTLSAPQGSIASSLRHMNYTKYLIDRYHEFKVIEIGRKAMKWPVFYQQIKREFGAKWDMIPLERFESLVEYIQSRINKTKHGRVQASRGGRNYSSFEDYLEKHGYLDC